jgi:hypothetical protein
MTYLALKLALLNALGWIQTHWRILLGVFIVVFVFAFVLKQCNRPAKLNQKELIEAQAAVEERNDEKLKTILAESDVRVKEIDANVANGRVELINAQYEAKKKYEGMSTDELAAELEKRK